MGVAPSLTQPPRSHMLIFLFEVCNSNSVSRGCLKDDLVEMIFAIRVVLMSLGWAVMLIFPCYVILPVHIYA